MKKNFRIVIAVLLIAALVSVCVTACGGMKDAFDEVLVADGVFNTAMPSTTAAATAAASWDYGPETATEAYDFEYESGSGISTAAGLTAAEEEALQNTGRKLIRNVNLNVETTEFDALIANISQSITAAGGYIERSDVSGFSIASSYSSRRYASITARIPAIHLDEFLAQVDEQSNVTNRSETVQDVTLQYTDIESRKKSLTVEQERLWELLEKADSLDSVIALEQRLSEIRYQLELFESQLRTYDNQVDYSTVCLYIDEVAVFTPTEPDSVLTRIQKGFARNLNDVIDGFVNFFVWFVSSIPTLIVWAVLLVILILIVRAAAKRSVRKAGSKASLPRLNESAAAENLQKPVSETQAADKTEEQKADKSE